MLSIGYTALYVPGGTFYGVSVTPETPVQSTLVTNMKADFAAIIGDWDEALIVRRLSATYDSLGRLEASAVWLPITTVNGDWQPVAGTTILEEQGLAVKSDAKVLIACNTNVREGDRIYRADGTFEYVNYVKKYAGHYTVFVTRTNNT